MGIIKPYAQLYRETRPASPNETHDEEVERLMIEEQFREEEAQEEEEDQWGLSGQWAEEMRRRSRQFPRPPRVLPLDDDLPVSPPLRTRHAPMGGLTGFLAEFSGLYPSIARGFTFGFRPSATHVALDLDPFRLLEPNVSQIMSRLRNMDSSVELSHESIGVNPCGEYRLEMDLTPHPCAFELFRSSGLYIEFSRYGPIPMTGEALRSLFYYTPPPPIINTPVYTRSPRPQIAHCRIRFFDHHRSRRSVQ